jgi:hypothetical protein
VVHAVGPLDEVLAAIRHAPASYCIVTRAVSAKRSEDGMMPRNINGTFMFRLDAVDVATGAATLEQIVERNKGKVFPNAPEE